MLLSARFYDTHWPLYVVLVRAASSLSGDNTSMLSIMDFKLTQRLAGQVRAGRRAPLTQLVVAVPVAASMPQSWRSAAARLSAMPEGARCYGRPQQVAAPAERELGPCPFRRSLCRTSW
jgi:hypothetical protein